MTTLSPPRAEVGRCYVQCISPEKFEMVSDNILLVPEREEHFAVPPLLETRTDSYLVRPAYVRLRVIDPEWAEEEVRICTSPAGRQVAPEAYVQVQDTVWIRPRARVYTVSEPVWEERMEAIEVEPSHQVIEVLPIKYQWVPLSVMVRPPSKRWIRKKVSGGCLEADPENCAVWCLIETPPVVQDVYKQELIGCDSEDPQDCIRYTFVPAKTELRPVQRLVSPAKAEERTEPGTFQIITRWQLRADQTEPKAPADSRDEYVTLRRKVLRREAYVHADTVPALYAPIQRKVLVQDGYVGTRRLPAEYGTVLKWKRIAESQIIWREILCEEQVSQLNVSQIQEALRARGYYKGRIDGVLNEQMRAAIAQFQMENDLPADGHLDVETLQALGIRK